MKGIATKPVSINWQIFFIIFIDVFAVYRIKKFRRYLLIVVIPAVLLITPINLIFTNLECEFNWLLFMIYDTCSSFELNLYDNVIAGIFLVYSIYFIRKWSIQWNKQYEV